ncbi:DUF1353 domain-containing protein [Nocardia puris]|uniref:Uncharacterized protein DUF1353 n=1 Tax=Nocardia puris TaxID=208602 RepID=A0A366DHC4_9NOCA|nr:DUF1353 domain-containing protein [Nocardia puris]MBF6213169.1 DUF1353 domain-containing protein [Nocardia puris]MBF6370203.1 DUF1353 domain-containing protein [Nocardia puris]RBO89345.1 uncharacterized protein DUF1353 [Nocardia puris]
MAFVGGGPIVEELDAQFWRLTEPLVYRGAVDEFTVPAGFRTDFASVPRALVWLIPRIGAYTRAAILHDYLLQSKVVSTVDADGLFRRCLRELGVSFARRWMMWAGVRVANRLAGTTAREFALFLLIAVPSVVFLAVPVIVVTLFLWLFWAVELVFWAVGKVLGRTTEAAPPPQMKTD